MRFSELPPAWACLFGKVNSVQQESPTTWTCSCPKCGGVPHDGEPSNRVTLFNDAHPTLFCRRCGLVAYPDMFGGEGFERPTPDALEVWRKQQIEREQARKRSAELALKHLRDTAQWECYYAALGDAGHDYWLARGLDRAWVDTWQLGWQADRVVMVDGQEHHTPSATIPIWGVGGDVQNIKHRLVNPPPKRGKYMYELSGLPQPVLVCNPDLDLSGHVVAVEGEVKAMVVFATLDDGKARVAGLPGVTPSDSALSVLSQAERVTLVLDPGTDVEANPKTGRTQAQELAARIGSGRCRVLVPPIKIDDAVLSTGMNGFELRTLFRQARKT